MKAANDNTRPGDAAEAVAVRHLEAHGLRVVARNFRCRGGEIDIVCRDGRTLVFVEVRLRSSDGFGGAGGSITATKRTRIVLAARHYLAAHPADAGRDCRFDCVLLADLNGTRLDWLKNAFAAD